MIRIKIFDQSTGQGILIKEESLVKQITVELTRIESDFKPLEDGFLSRMASDCEITILDDVAVQKKYKLYGRAILVDEDNNTSAQFYMGLLLLEWLRR